MIDYQPLFDELGRLGMGGWAKLLAGQIERAFDSQTHGDLQKWQKVIDELPCAEPSSVDLLNKVCIGWSGDLSDKAREQVFQGLMQLHPWRKGPFQIYGIELDSEWRSDWKWERLRSYISPLRNRVVLDVGCGNGYYCWRILGAGARLVVGIDPMLLNVMQFQALHKLYCIEGLYVLPVGVEDLPSNMMLFDTVFSMGVLYHRRSPIDHLMELKACLRSGGELVLETLVIDGGVNDVLMPEERYAQMRNVWFIPSSEALLLWLRRCGYKNIRLCSVVKTTIQEQRATEWMRFNSLADFLNPNDDRLTCEGLPAPMRALITATIS